MIANTAVMMLLVQENQRRGGWGRDPHGDGVIGFLMLVLLLILATASVLFVVLG